MISSRIAGLSWPRIEADLNEFGCASTGAVLSIDECAQLVSNYPNDEMFRSKVVMSRHGFGRGEYKYYAYPLPPLIESLRKALYLQLVSIANRWEAAMGH